MGGLSFGKSDLSLNKQAATRRTSSMVPPSFSRILMAIWGPWGYRKMSSPYTEQQES